MLGLEPGDVVFGSVCFIDHPKPYERAHLVDVAADGAGEFLDPADVGVGGVLH